MSKINQFQRAILITQNLQHYRFLGQFKLYWRSGLPRMSRQIWTIFWSKKDWNYLDVKLKVLNMKDDKIEFCLIQNLEMLEGDFNRFMRLRNQLVNAAENYSREENLSPVLIATKSRDMDEQLKLYHKVAELLRRANRKICVTLLRFNMAKPQSSNARVRFFARMTVDEKFH